MKFLDNLNVNFFDAHKLRGKNFYKNLMIDNNKILNRFGHLTTKKNFKCKICGSNDINKFFLKINKKYFLRKCRKCNLVFPNIDTNVIEDYEKKIYENYHATSVSKSDNKNKNYRNKKFLEERYNYTYKKLFGLNKKKKVIEIGCGRGDFLKYLKGKKIKAKGVEFDSHLVQVCKRKQLDVVYGNIDDKKLKYYDLCVMFDVLEHLTDPVKYLKKITKTLKKNSYLVFYTPNIKSMGFELMNEKQNLIYPFHHLSFFDKKSIKYLAKKLNMKIISYETYGLDLIDYFLYKEKKDNYYFTKKLYSFMAYMQSVLDKFEISNHSRVILKK